MVLNFLVLCTVLTLCFVKILSQLIHKTYDSDVKLNGKVVIVTGANTGIGYATAEDLAKRGAKVILACRDIQKGLTARDKLIQSTGNINIIYKCLDLSSFKSVRSFAEEIIRSESKLDVLINNAGTLYVGNYLTEDNLPIEAQVNHFSPFLLTMLLLPLLKSSAPSRIINVSSLFYIFGNVQDLHKQTKCSVIEHFIEKIYCNTKLANVLFTRKLSEHLNGTGVTVNCLHPGAVATDLHRHRRYLSALFSYLIGIPTEQGAQTSIYLAVDPTLNTVSGKYFSNCKESSTLRKARDDKAAEKLWTLTENIVFGENKQNAN